MMDFFDEINNLVGDIVNHNINVTQTQIRIDELKKKYGDNSFLSIYFEKKPLPWDEVYMRKLKEKNITGACSEEFLLHMAEVSDYIYQKKNKRKLIALVIGGIFLLVIIFIMFL